MAQGSISPHKRLSLKTLEGQFGIMSITKTVYKTIDLPKSIGDTTRLKMSTKGAKLTLKMDPNYDYHRFMPDPDEVFEESARYFGDIHKMITQLKEENSAYEDYLVESMVMMIFTSNGLENAGSSHPVTLRLCQEIFAGRQVPEEIGEHDEDYEAFIKHLVEKKGPKDHKAVLRSRKQIIQHAYALKYITYRMVVKGEDLSEEILLETHKILTDGIDAENAERDSSDTYGGLYRTSNVGWTFGSFANPNVIPVRMAEAISSYNITTKKAESVGTMDPYQIAAKFGHIILNIHPFLDGNSRLTRLFMNTIILKYTGTMIPIGRDSTEAAKWKETVTRAAEVEAQDEELRGGKAVWAELATLVVIQGRSTLRVLKERLTAFKEGKDYNRRKSIVGYHWETSGDDGAEVE